MNTPIDYSSWYSFGHFCCWVNDSETTHLAGYNILVFKYVKISVGLPLLFIGAIREKSSKSSTSNVLNNKRLRQMKRARF